MRRRNSDGGSARSNGTLPASGRRLTRAATAAAAAAAAATSAGKTSTYSGRPKSLEEYGLLANITSAYTRGNVHVFSVVGDVGDYLETQRFGWGVDLFSYFSWILSSDDSNLLLIFS